MSPSILSVKQLKLKEVKNLLLVEPRFEAKPTWIQSVLLSCPHNDYTLASPGVSNHNANIIKKRTW